MQKFMYLNGEVTMEKKIASTTATVSDEISIAIRQGIRENAVKGRALTSNNCTLERNYLDQWKVKVSALVSAVSAYASVLVKSSTYTEDFRMETCGRVYDCAERQAVFTALRDVKNYAGYVFKFGSNDPEILVMRMVTVRTEKDSNGNIIRKNDFIGTDTTARKNVEYFLYCREQGIEGMTTEEHSAFRAEQNKLKKAREKAEKAAKKATAIETKTTSEQEQKKTA